MKNESIYYFKKLKEKYLLLRSGEIAIFAIAGAMLVFGLTSFLNISPSLRLITTIAGGIIVFLILFSRLKLYRFNNNRLVRFINHHVPVLEHSTDLLLKDEETLTSLQKLQREKVDRYFVDLVAGIKLPHQMGRAAIVLGATVVLTITIVSLREKTMREARHKTNETASAETGWSTQMPVSVEALTISVSPPRYTGVANYATEEPNLSIPAGSHVQWKILFSDSVGEPALVFPAGDSLKLSPNGKNYEAARAFSESNIYQLSWRSMEEQGRISDYYKVEVIKDQPPRITLPQQAEYTHVSHEDDQTVPLRVSIVDDYGLKDAYVIATVSKGSGESIKFREEKLLFTSPSKVSGRRAQLTRTIDLKALGLAPGDELYFYVEALDNKTPGANRARTQTYFISLPDTASQMLSVEAGLGVDLMPAYFRSQRQIIIDSEKLLRDRKTISEAVFKSRSNEIGYDQKVLRLKYGEFLGEEFETNIGPGGEPPESEEEEHHHNEGEEENHNEGEEEDPTAAYKHVHDDPEEATFFTQSIRSKLKAALSAMWDAELHLRTFDPKTSLPYQYVALRLLKEISQDSRIYVHKTGFDPPPIKEEKRLTGDLSEINNSTSGLRAHQKVSYPAIRSALAITEEWMARPGSSLTKHRKEVLLLAGQELATLALDQPGGNYLSALSVIKSLSEEEIPSQEVANSLLFLRKVFWTVLPKEMASPDKPLHGLHGLDRAFIDHLKSLSDE